jgi:glycosyltransferase involved in cell wall biosynthesis
MQKNKKALFLTLKIFSATGGIEKVCRIVSKALNESGFNLKVFSMYDTVIPNEKYFPSHIFTGFSNNKISFILKSFKEGIQNKIVILSHINLLSVGYFIKLFSPKTQIVLFAHGVEVWQPLSAIKKKMLKKCDKILSVSNHTKRKIVEFNDVDTLKCEVLNNCLDPFLENEENLNEYNTLLNKYKFSKGDFILLTVTRIAEDEQYKGHDKVIEALGKIINEFPNVRYLIAGKYDPSEKKRLDDLIKKNNVHHAVIFTGYIPDEELPGYYNMADVFIMPSKGEGFGIVFIEAMYYGLPIIAGNKDGSADALLNGRLGLLVDPDNEDEIVSAIKKVIKNPTNQIPDNNLLLDNFGFDKYKKHLALLISYNAL